MHSASVAAASSPSPRKPATPQHRSSWGAAPPHRHLAATYDSAATNGPQSTVILSPKVRRALVSQPQQPARAPRLGHSFDESLMPLQQQQQQYPHHSKHRQLHLNPQQQQQQPSRRMLSQSISSSSQHAPPPPSQGWSLGASVYCRFVVQVVIRLVSRDVHVAAGLRACLFAICRREAR